MIPPDSQLLLRFLLTLRRYAKKHNALKVHFWCHYAHTLNFFFCLSLTVGFVGLAEKWREYASSIEETYD